MGNNPYQADIWESIREPSDRQAIFAYFGKHGTDDEGVAEWASFVMLTCQSQELYGNEGALLMGLKMAWTMPTGRGAIRDAMREKRWTREERQELERALTPVMEDQGKEDGPGRASPGETQAEILIGIAKEKTQLMITDGGERLASVTYDDGHREVYTIGERGSTFRDWIVTEYLGVSGDKPPSTTALSQAMEVIAANCWRFGERVDVFTRLAEANDKIYLDIGEASGAAVEIDADGWRMVRHPPVYFRRAPGMTALPEPQRGASMHDLPAFFGLDAGSEEAMLIMAWLVGAMRPRGPYTVLNLRGEKGSRKTTVTQLLRQLIDPNVAPVRQAPRDDETLMLAAKNSYIVALDNVSHIPSWLSDALCCLSTGYGFGRRRLYTSDQEFIVYLARPMILNGITEVVSRGDLLDRLISVELPVVEPEQRLTHDAIEERFAERRPFLLGALLGAVSTALKFRGRMTFTRAPRMADFALWVEAAAPAMGWAPGQFLELYNDQSHYSAQVEIEGSPVASALMMYLQEHGRIEHTSLLSILQSLSDIHTDMGRRKPDKEWPTTETKLGREFSRIAPAIRDRGFTIEKRRTKHSRSWAVLPHEKGDESSGATRHGTPLDSSPFQGKYGADDSASDGQGRYGSQPVTATGSEGVVSPDMSPRKRLENNANQGNGDGCRVSRPSLLEKKIIERGERGRIEDKGKNPTSRHSRHQEEKPSKTGDSRDVDGAWWRQEPMDPDVDGLFTDWGREP